MLNNLVIRLTQKHIKTILLALATLSAVVAIYLIQKYPYFIGGDVPYDFYVTLINYNDFGFVKRGLLNSIFVTLGLDLTDKLTHIIVRSTLMILLFGYGAYHIRKIYRLHGERFPIEIIFICTLLTISPSGLLHLSKILIPHLFLFLIYFIAIEHLFRSHKPNVYLLTALSILGILQHEIWVFVSLPLLLVLLYDKTESLKSLIFMTVISFVVLMLCREFGNMSYTDRELYEKMIHHFPKMTTDYTIKYSPHYFNTNIWTKNPHIEYQRILERKHEVFIPLFCCVQLFLAQHILKKSNAKHSKFFILALSCVFACFIIGTDYGRWSAYFATNTILVFLYFFQKSPFSINRKLMLACLSFILIFKPFYYNITYYIIPSEW